MKIILKNESKIGGIIALKVYLIFTFILALFLFIIDGMSNFEFDCFYSFILIAIVTFYFGSKAGIQILINEKNEDLIGIKTGFLILLTFILIRLPLDWDLNHSIKNFKGFILGVTWIIAYMILPVIVYGIIIGRKIKRERK